MTAKTMPSKQKGKIYALYIQVIGTFLLQN